MNFQEITTPKILYLDLFLQNLEKKKHFMLWYILYLYFHKLA